jgi:hypothetical protein
MPVAYRDLVPYLSTYKGGSTVPCGTSAAGSAITIPALSNWAWIHAEGAAVYWAVNAGSATSLSPGYVAQDQTGLIAEIDNFGTLHVNGYGTAAVAHVEFYQA